MQDRDCVAFLQWALPRLRLRWPGFRKVRRQVCKRIARRLAELGLGDLDAYRSRLESDPREWGRLDASCRITISRFFRDRAVFDRLGREVLPELAAGAAERGESELSGWSAGCASGEEPYSLGILWGFAIRPRFPDLDLRLTGTDADDRLLERARVACYGASAVRDVPPGWRERAFDRVGELYRLEPGFREGIDWRCEEIRDTVPEGPFRIVLCRNLVFTYFEETLQREVLQRIVHSIAPGGVLVVGRHEALPTGEFGLRPMSAGSCMYRKNDELRRERVG